MNFRLSIEHDTFTCGIARDLGDIDLWGEEKWKFGLEASAYIIKFDIMWSALVELKDSTIPLVN